MSRPLTRAEHWAVRIIAIAGILACAKCGTPRSAATAIDAGDGGWQTVVLPASFDAGNGSLR